MELWGKDDTLSRWVNVVCALPLLAFIVFDIALICQGIISIRLTSASVVAIYFAFKLLRYALTGRNNINREDY